MDIFGGSCFLLFIVSLFVQGVGANERDCLNPDVLIDPPTLRQSHISFAAYKEEKDENKNVRYRVLLANRYGVFTSELLDETGSPFLKQDGLPDYRVVLDDYNSRLFMLNNETLVLIGYTKGGTIYAKRFKFVLAQGTLEPSLVTEDVAVRSVFKGNSNGHLRLYLDTEDSIFLAAGGQCNSLFKYHSGHIPLCEAKPVFEKGAVDPLVYCPEMHYYCLSDTILGQINIYLRRSYNSIKAMNKDTSLFNFTHVDPFIHYKRAGNSFQELALPKAKEYLDKSTNQTMIATHKLIVHFRNTNVTDISGDDSSICVLMPQDTRLGMAWDAEWDAEYGEYQDINFVKLDEPEHHKEPCPEKSLFETVWMFVLSVVLAIIVTFIFLATVMIGHAGARRRKRAKEFFDKHDKRGGRSNRTEMTETDEASVYSTYTQR